MLNCRFINLIIFIPLFFTSCSEDELVSFSTGFEFPVIYGYYNIDHLFWYGECVGHPNIHLDDPRIKCNCDDWMCMKGLRISPNPVQNYVHVLITADSEIKPELYIVPAHNSLSTINSFYNCFNAMFLYTKGLPVIKLVPALGFNRIDLSNIEDGFYRVYVKIGDVLLYDNMFKCNTQFY